MRGPAFPLDRPLPSRPRSEMKRAVLALSGTVLTACVVVWARSGDQTGRIAAHLACYLVAFAAYLAALWSSRDLSRRGLVLALIVGAAWRAALVAAPALVSNDVNRSVWEGRVQVHGGNPYAWPDRPDAPKWTALRDEVWLGLNHPDYPAIYPPAWQLAMFGVASLSDSIIAVKAFVASCDLAALLPLAFLLRRRGQPLSRLLVLAWSPLALVETAGGGHNEAFGVLFVVLALAALESKRPLWSALASAVGLQAKFLPGLIAAAWARCFRVGHVAAAAVLAAAFVWPYRSAGQSLWLSLGKYSEFWQFNETAFALVAGVAGSHTAAVRVGSVSVLVLALFLAWRRADPVEAAVAVVAASLLLSPNVLPWYALWFVPLLVLRDEPAALLYTGTASFAYLVYPTWQSGERWWIGWDVRALEYLPCLLVFWMSRRRLEPPEITGPV
jgi:alpha-1,6-mannosyltransferase